jgi:Ca2+-binding RTX toxin-like protein
VTLVLNGNGTATIIVGHSPALTVTQARGAVIVANVTVTTATDAPTILVSGGSLTLRDVVIQESTGFTDAAISVTDGSVDLGTMASPGGNILNVNGPGEFVHNATAASVPATGDTFELNGVPISAPYLSFTSLASSSTTTVYGQAVTLTATVRADTTAGSGTPTGNMDFFDVSTNTDLGSVSLNGGSVSLTTAALGAGHHLIRASYSGDSHFTSSLDALTQTVSQATTGTQVTSSANPAVYGQSVTFTATVSNASGTGVTPAGTVQFTVDGANLGSPIPLGASGRAISPPVSFPAGTSHTVSASYVPLDANFVASDNTLSQVVLAPGVYVYGTTHYIVGGSTSSDTALVKPAGAMADGSTGLAVGATLNKVSVSKSFTQTFTAIILAGYAGNETFTLAPTLTLPTTVTAGDGNDIILLGGGNNAVALGGGSDSVAAGGGINTVTASNGNDIILLGGGNNTVTAGNGNDAIGLGDGSNVVVEGNGNDAVAAGNGNNLIVAGLGRHTIRVGKGTNILIDGSATVNHSGDSLRQILNDWTANPVASNRTAIRSRFTVNYNAKYANALTAGSGIDWFFYQSPTTSNKKSKDFLN